MNCVAAKGVLGRLVTCSPCCPHCLPKSAEGGAVKHGVGETEVLVARQARCFRQQKVMAVWLYQVSILVQTVALSTTRLQWWGKQAPQHHRPAGQQGIAALLARASSGARPWSRFPVHRVSGVGQAAAPDISVNCSSRGQCAASITCLAL
ncbi:hypothetical protein O3P69_001126 [Scylla paramamosain]|uniref:Uncharacterized protein n=1 Tax=Scylla paramamosain TaxID=85552 RepID=A0AAW0UP35_SCYPA